MKTVEQFIEMAVEKGVKVEDIILNHIINLDGLFVNKNFRQIMIINGKELITSDGDVCNIYDFFNSDLKGSDRVVPVYSICKLINCKVKLNGESYILTLDRNIKEKSLDSEYVLVKNYNSSTHIYTVISGKERFRLPAHCLEVVDYEKSNEFRSIFKELCKNAKYFNIKLDNNYFDISKCGNFVNYVAKSKIKKYLELDKDEKQKTNKKIRGFFQSMFDCTVDSIEEAMIKSGILDVDVEVLTGNDILKVFDSDNIVESGTLGSSCMMNKPESYFDIYVENASAVVMRNSNGKIIARALLWDLNDGEGCTQKMMDRIYTSDTKYELYMKSWAMKKDYLFLTKQTYRSRYATSDATNSGDGDIYLGNYYIQLESSYYMDYPYLDTFRYMLFDRLYAVTELKELDSTSGSHS